MSVSSWNDFVGSRHGDKARHLLALVQDRPLPATYRVASDAWQYEGACVPPAGASVSDRAALIEAFDEPAASVERLAMVRGVCASCPVLVECGELGTEMRYGFFGGLTPEERKARRRGDGRSHEQLAAEGSRTDGGRAGARPKTSHGGVRRGAGWSAVVGAVADGAQATEVMRVDLEAGPKVAAAAGSHAVSTSRVASRPSSRGPRVLVRGDGAARWHAVAARFAALGGEQAAPTVCCSAALPRRVATQ